MQDLGVRCFGSAEPESCALASGVGADGFHPLEGEPFLHFFDYFVDVGLSEESSGSLPSLSPDQRLPVASEREIQMVLESLEGLSSEDWAGGGQSIETHR